MFFDVDTFVGTADSTVDYRSTFDRQDFKQFSQ